MTVSTQRPLAAANLHPDAERLAQHAAGQLRPVERVIVEAHLAYCTSCLDQLRALLGPGGRWLEEVAGAPLPEGAWEKLERKLDEPPIDPRPAQFPEAGVRGALLPAAALAELPDPRPRLEWQTVPTTRARYARLAFDSEADIDLVLIGLDGGHRFPSHVHLGNEEVVVLTGAYRDQFTHLGPGNYFHYPPGSEHATAIDPGEPCWTVGLLEHGIRFRGVLGVLQWIADPVLRARWRRFRSESRSSG